MPKFTANLSVLFTELALADRFKAAKHAGFNAVEIQFPYTLSAKQIKQLLDENNLKLVLFNIDADDLLQGGEGLAAVPEKKTQYLQALRQCESYAKILTPDCINVLPGRCFNEARTDEYLATFQHNLSLALNCFSPLGIKTVFEAINTVDMPHFIIHSGQQMLTIMAQIKHPMLFMQYDIYHMQMMNEHIQEFIQQHARKIAHIQFADAPNRGEPSTGMIDFSHLFKVIEQSDYAGWLGAEYKPSHTTSSSLAWLKHYSE